MSAHVSTLILKAHEMCSWHYGNPLVEALSALKSGEACAFA